MSDVFFVVAKAVWLLLRPETLLILLLVVGFVLTLFRRRSGVIVTGVGVLLVLLTAYLPLGELALQPLERRFAAEPEVEAPAGILLLGGSEEQWMTQHWGPVQVNGSADRYIAAIELAQRFPEVPVLFAGGGAVLTPGALTEARVAARILAAAGIDPGRVILEDRSRNTAENAANALDLRPEGLEAGPWLLVTSAAHMPRAVGAFCAAGWQGIVPWPTDHITSHFHPHWRFALNLAGLNVAMREWVGLAGYRVTGRTDAFLGEGCPPR